MKKLILVFTVFSLFALNSCKQTQEVVQEEPIPRTAPMKEKETTEQQFKNRQSRGLSVAEIQVLDDFANQKADFVCKINKLQSSPPTSDQQAAAIKEKIIQLEARLKEIEAEINQYLNSDVRMHYFHKALDQAIYRCSH